MKGNNTFFQHCKLDFMPIFRLIFCWFDKMSVTKAAFHNQVSKAAAIKVYRHLREICLTVVRHDAAPIGGNGDIVEVDESHLFTRKYHRGRLLRRQMGFWWC